MIVYSFLSHDCRLLPYQVATIRRHLQPSAIVVIVGPYGSHPITSAGDVRLRPGIAEHLGVEVLAAPEWIAGHMHWERLCCLYETAFADHQQRDDEWALVMHGDLFPIRDATTESIAQGRCFAARYHNGTDVLAMTWMLRRRNFELPPKVTLNMRVPGTKYGHVRTADQFGYELCDPCFLHADKLASAHWPNGYTDRFEAKLADLPARLGVPPITLDCCEQLTGLPNHAPRMPAPASIPDDYDPRSYANDSKGNPGCNCA